MEFPRCISAHKGLQRALVMGLSLAFEGILGVTNCNKVCRSVEALKFKHLHQTTNNRSGVDADPMAE